MQYRRFGDRIVARIDRGEEIVASLARLCAAEEVELASVTAIGAVNAFKVGVFSPVDKVYKSNAFSGDYEIVSLSGSVTAKDGAPYIHLTQALPTPRAGGSAGTSTRRLFPPPAKCLLIPCPARSGARSAKTSD